MKAVEEACRYVKIKASTQSITVPQANISFTITIDELQELDTDYQARIWTLPYSKTQSGDYAMRYFDTSYVTRNYQDI